MAAGKGVVSRILLHVWRTLVAGTLAAFPLIVTYWMIHWLFGFLDGLFAPLVDHLSASTFPGVRLLHLPRRLLSLRDDLGERDRAAARRGRSTGSSACRS